MAREFSICEVRWERYRRVSENPHAREWLKFQAARGLAANTIEAYGRDLDYYLGFLETESTSPCVGSSRLASIFTVVLLPDPFGPRQPSTSPG